MSKVVEIIKDFEKTVEDWNEKYKNNNDICFVYNNDLKTVKNNITNIKYILVGDNPEKDEKTQKRYLIGKAGVSARVFFENFLVKDFVKEVLVLNKTPIHTNVTEGLKSADKSILADSIEKMTEIIINLHKELQVPVIISGFMGSFSSGKLVRNTKNNLGFDFFKLIRKEIKKEFVFIIKHFSRQSIYDDLTIKVFEEYKDGNVNILNLIGRKYTEALYERK